jgi:Domain of unknown function (DUF4145)
MLIECYDCKARVDAEVIAYHQQVQFDIFRTRTYLLKCPACSAAIVGETEEDARDGKTFWPDLTRVFPKPRRLLGSGIPDIARRSIDEAEKCIQAGAFLAATAMCGRALEAICRYHGTSDTYLGAGLKELRDKGIIDARLLQWGEELRDQRNRAAHATDETISAQDASDVLAFTYAIIDYVFLLTMKFEQFRKRKEERKHEKSSGKSAKPDA